MGNANKKRDNKRMLTRKERKNEASSGCGKKVYFINFIRFDFMDGLI